MNIQKKNPDKYIIPTASEYISIITTMFSKDQTGGLQ